MAQPGVAIYEFELGRTGAIYLTSQPFELKPFAGGVPAYCLLLTAYGCLLLTARLPPASCLLPSASCFIPDPVCVRRP